MLSAPFDGLGTDDPWNPHRRMRLLIRQCPRIHVAIVKMLALVAPGTRPRPRLHDEVVRFVEVLAIVRGIRVVEELLAPRPANPSGYQPSARDQIDLRQFLRHPQRMLDNREWISDQQDACAL